MGLLRFVLIGAIVPAIHAQDRTATLTGVVTDVTGAGISGASAQAEGERKSLAPMPLVVGNDCGSGRVTLDYVRLFASQDHMGRLRGSVKIEKGRSYLKRPPAPGANITLIADEGKILAETATDLNGEFLFKNLPAGDFSIRVKRAGFYTVEESGLVVREGFESTYWPIGIEHCPRGNCDPALRTKKIIICQ